MRLSDLERRALAHAIGDIPYRVSIFGSRLDDGARGGDIDLMLLAPSLPAAERLAVSLRVAVAFRSICDEKIDVHVMDPLDLTAAERAFLAAIHSEPLDVSPLAEPAGNTP